MDKDKWLKKKEKALKENNKDMLYESYKSLAGIHIDDGQYEKALSYYKRGLTLCEKIVDIAVMNRMIGEVYCLMGEFEDAITHQKKHLELSKQEENNVEIQRALATLGRTYFVKGESYTNPNNKERMESLQTSYKYYLASLQTCQSLDNISSQQLAIMKSRLYLNTGLTLEALGRNEESVENIQKAISIYKSNDLNIISDLNQYYMCLASVYFKQHRHNEALNTIQKSLHLPISPDNQCELLLLKADIHIDLFDFQSAKSELVKAYKLKTVSKSNRHDVEKKLKLVIVLLNNEKTLLGLDLDEDDKNIDQIRLKKVVYEKMGDACSALYNFSKAVHFYHKMLDCCEKMIKLTYSDELNICFDQELSQCSVDLSSVLSSDACKDLAACYVSLSQTYKDNKQYDLALDYFNKELKLYRNNPTEACKTLTNICEIFDLQKTNFELIYETYQKALTLCKKNDNRKLERIVLNSMKHLCEEHARVEEMKKLDAELETLGEEYSYSEEEEEDDTEETPNVGEDVDLDELSDFNEEAVDEEKRVTRRRQNKNHFAIKRNDKGETALHVAAARGNLIAVRSLLKQGHPLNVQDAAGWLPLHEAANHGNTAVVEALLEAGADPNDKGGTGLSPLHDAAASGHLEVIEVLLEKGASTSQKTNKGETALDCLVQCKARVEQEQGTLAPHIEAHFRRVVQKLKVPEELTAITSQRLKTQSTSSRVNSSALHTQQNKQRIRRGNISSEVLARPNATKDINKVGNLRNNPRETSLSPLRREEHKIENLRSASRETSLSPLRHGSPLRIMSPEDTSSSPTRQSRSNSDDDEEVSATREYQKAMDNLRRNTVKTDLLRGRFVKSGASHVKEKQFLEDSEVGDDWLENDLETKNNKKRKFVEIYNKVSNVNSRNAHLEANRKKIRNYEQVMFKEKNDSPLKVSLEQNSFKQNKNVPKVDLTNSFSQPLFPEDTAHDLPRSSGTHSSINENTNLHRFSSKEHLNRFDSRESLNSIDNERFRDRSQCGQNVTQRARLETIDEIFTNETRYTPRCTQSVNIKIKIENNLLLIPIKKNTDLDLLTISWLKKEASQRYYKLEGITPVLRIQTQDGALVDDNDPLESILNESIVQTQVIAWNTPPIINRYYEVCSESKVSIHSHIETTLKNHTNTFKMCSCFKSERVVNAFFKTILRWNDLTEINLSRSFLRDPNIEILSDNMINLSKLEILNLSCNRITHIGVKHLSSKASSLIRLKQLDLSFNPLSNQSLEYINTIVNICQSLNTLNLAKCQLSSFSGNMSLNLYNVENINVSMNELGVNEVSKLLNSLNCDIIKHLNLNNTLDAKTKHLVLKKLEQEKTAIEEEKSVLDLANETLFDKAANVESILEKSLKNQSTINSKGSADFKTRSKSPNFYFEPDSTTTESSSNRIGMESRIDCIGEEIGGNKHIDANEHCHSNINIENSQNFINTAYLNGIQEVLYTTGDVSAPSITREIILFLEQTESCPLVAMNISAVGMSNQEAAMLFRVLATCCKHLEKIDLSCNPQISKSNKEMIQNFVIRNQSR